MKQFLNKLWVAAVVVALAGFLANTSLARPESAGPEQDQFIGYHLVYERLPPSEEELESHPELYQKDRSQWTEYGSESIKVDGFGTLEIPREILIGQRQENGHYLFPGLDGYNAFLAVVAQEDGSLYNSGYVDLADGHISVGGDEESLSGTLYMGLPLGMTEEEYYDSSPDYGWTAYAVYQMADGTIYLNGAGNSYSNAGGMEIFEKYEYTVTENGKSTSKSFEISVSFETVPRLESVELRQYAGDDRLLSREELTPGDFSPDMGLIRTLDPSCDWVMVLERAADGTVTRTVYGAEEVEEADGLSHQLILLDDAGMGRPVYLILI